MTGEQMAVVGLLVGTMVLFVWGRWRHDIVAFSALMAATVTGLVPAAGAFVGFGHPAVFTVAAVLLLSAALQESGAVDAIARRLEPLSDRPGLQLLALTGLAMVLSGVMNNVGALALLMPVALQMAARSGRPVSEILMPLSFASILGGLTTLIGTPPNIIVAEFRRETGEAPFAMFDFTPIGIVLAVVGVIFVNAIGWRLIPKARARSTARDLFEIEDYVTEVRVPSSSKMVGRSIRDLVELVDEDLRVVGLMRDGHTHFVSLRWEELRPGDVLILHADSGMLERIVKEAGLELGAEELDQAHLATDDTSVIEVVITPGSGIVGRSAARLGMRSRYGVQLLAVARQGRPFKKRLQNVGLRAGDVLLLQGNRDALPETLTALGCLPLAERGLRASGPKKRLLAPLAFAGALGASAVGLLPVQIAFGAAVALLVLSGAISVRQLYGQIDWSVLVLLAAMIPIGGALEDTGATQLLADSVAGLADVVPVWLILALILAVTMTLSDFMNNAATAVVMAPIAATVARGLEVNTDPFLMAVAIGASCAFLTPIGHQNNVLVMGPGGYRFGDYWRMGLPLEVVLVAVSVPLLLVVWPL